MAELFSNFRESYGKVKTVVFISCGRVVWQSHQNIYPRGSCVFFSNAAAVIPVDNEPEQFGLAANGFKVIVCLADIVCGENRLTVVGCEQYDFFAQ